MKKFVLIFSLIFIAGFNTMKAQVTIGSNIAPSAGALLDLKENASVAPSPNSTKGVLFPKVALQGRTILQPLFTAGTPSSQDSLNTTGMVVYNVSENTMENGAGLYVWDGEEWLPITISSGAAAFTISDCNNIQISGYYTKNAVLKAEQNHITLTVSVQKRGYYNILISPDSSNGYYFFASGVFEQPGTYAITVQGAGMPLSAQTDQLTFQLNGQPFEGFSSGDCPLSIDVLAQQADFTINCSNITVSGSYVANVPLSDANTMSVVMTATPASIGTTYVLQTNTQNGYSFSATGTITSLTQTITLVGSGTPVEPKVDIFTVQGNSIQKSSSCTQNIQVIPRTVKILGLGGYWYNVGNNRPTTGAVDMVMNKIIHNPDYFGPSASAVYPVGGVVICKESNGEDWRPNATQLRDTINKYNPDIIIGGYEVSITAAHMTLFQDFVNKGGVLIYIYNEAETVSKQLIDNLFYNGVSTVTVRNGESQSGGATLPWEDVSHPIMKGPFLDLYPDGVSTYYMQQDAGGNASISVNSTPNIENATVLVKNVAGTGARVFVHNTKGILWVGDGGAIAGASAQLANTTAWPIKVVGTAPYGTMQIGASNSTGNNAKTTSAHFFANALAWAMSLAQATRPTGLETYNLQ